MKSPLRLVSELIPLSRGESTGRELYELIKELFPICRSITGEGLRSTLRILQKHIPLTLEEIPTGTPAFDWTVPKEWNIRDAYIKNSSGERIVDFQKSNLCVLNYSIPVNRKISLDELRAHLFTLPEQPEAIPYRTSYYREAWGFCLPHRLLESLAPGEYQVQIDSTLAAGHLSYGELLLPGESDEEILISAHACHPSLANDNLSGVAVAAFLARSLADVHRRYSYRFLFLPGTIGSIVWLSRNQQSASRISHGLVLACLGDSGSLSYKKSRRGDAEVDRVAVHVLKHLGSQNVRDFSPYGYDERQYCSPGFNLSVGCLSRTPHGQFPEYHTSEDNLDFVRPDALADSCACVLSILAALEENQTYRNRNPMCEPQLGRRGLYRQLGGLRDAGQLEMAMLWLLNLSDETHSVIDIAERSNLPFDCLRTAAATLRENGLLEAVVPRTMKSDVSLDSIAGNRR